MHYRALQLLHRPRRISSRRPQETSAAGGGRYAPDPVEGLRAALERIEQRLCAIKLAERNKRFECVRQEPQAHRLADAMPFPEASEWFRRAPRPSRVVD